MDCLLPCLANSLGFCHMCYSIMYVYINCKYSIVTTWPPIQLSNRDLGLYMYKYVNMYIAGIIGFSLAILSARHRCPAVPLKFSAYPWAYYPRQTPMQTFSSSP